MIMWIALIATALYSLWLFMLAHRGDQKKSKYNSSWIFGLSLGVYCTSWTFYGAVGTAVNEGWQFLPIYLGPILLFLFGRRFLDHILKLGKAQHSTSIADFLSARYGKSARIAAMVTIIAIFGSLPYMALQLKSVSQTLLALAPSLALSFGGEEVVMGVAVTMALFAVLFGTGRLDLTHHNRGMVLAIAAEAIIKLIALMAVAAFAILLMMMHPTEQMITEQALTGQALTGQAITDVADNSFGLHQFDSRFFVMTFISALAVLCLPRQFHMFVVEAQRDKMDRPMRWIFPTYLILTSLAVFPVVMAGDLLLPDKNHADMLMLNLPLAYGNDWLAILAFIGGFSASTGMIIVTTIALSSMITNDLIIPLFYRERMNNKNRAMPMGAALIRIRRITIMALVALAYLYYRSISSGATLASLGQLAFTAAAQFAPGLLIGLIWRGANQNGMLIGLLGGFFAWLLLLFIPAYSNAMPPMQWGDDALVSGIIISLFINSLLLLFGSLVSSPNLIDRSQASAFIDVHNHNIFEPSSASSARVADYRLLLEHFVGHERSRIAFNNLRLHTGRNYHDIDRVDEELFTMTERQVSGILGSSSARALVESTLEGDAVPIERVVAMFDETSQRLQFSSDLLQTAIENIDQGIALVDRDLQLVAWNRRYVDMFGLPASLVETGRPIEDLIRFNMRQLNFSEAIIDSEISKRLNHLRAGHRHSTERELADGRVLRILGNPTPNGGYVTSYTDITIDRMTEQALEKKVAERTEQLTQLNAALQQATRSKTRFLAAASHDLVQPLNAARLFASALDAQLDAEKAEGEKENGQKRKLLDNIDKSIGTANRLLRALLDISKLDGGAIKPNVAPVSLHRLLDDIATEFSVSAAQKNIILTVVCSSLWVESDRGLLMSIMQNLTTNAVRYTQKGRVLIGAKRRAGHVQIYIIDTGPGISHHEQDNIFEEFIRLKGESDSEGLGLGLAIVRRIADIIGTKIMLKSQLGQGSSFSFTLPITAPGIAEQKINIADNHRPMDENIQKTILCIDNDPAALDGLYQLLSRWGFAVQLAQGLSDIIGDNGPDNKPHIIAPDLLIIDHHLDDDVRGVDIYRQLQNHWNIMPSTILYTAEESEETALAAKNMDAYHLIKPASPSALRALINQKLA